MIDHIQQILTLIFTAVIAASTVVYTLFSFRLWKTTRASVDLARYTAFMNIILLLDGYARQAKAQNRPEGILFEQFGALLLDFGIEHFLKDIDLKNDKMAIDYFAKIEGLFRGHNIDPNTVPWLRKILDAKS